MECAFCNNSAVEKGGEHLWDNWINKEIPKTRFNAKKKLALDAEPIEFVQVGLQEKVPAVCTPCNQGWMSTLTAGIKERFSRTVLEGSPFSLTLRDAATLAAFTFLKAAVKDYGYSEKPFFIASTRRNFKHSLRVPPSTQVWFGAFQGLSKISFVSSFRIGSVGPGPLEGIELFSYTYIMGNLALQILVPRWKDVTKWRLPLPVIAPNPAWESVATRFWPFIGEVNWPPPKCFGDDTIEHFINRFGNSITMPLY